MYIERLRPSCGMTRQEVPWSWPWHVYLASIAYHSHFEACFGRSEDKWREISAAQHILGPRTINPDERMGNRQERSDKEKSDCDWLEIIINLFSVSDYLVTFTHFCRFKLCMWGPEVLCRTVKACPELLCRSVYVSVLLLCVSFHHFKGRLWPQRPLQTPGRCFLCADTYCQRPGPQPTAFYRDEPERGTHELFLLLFVSVWIMWMCLLMSLCPKP